MKLRFFPLLAILILLFNLAGCGTVEKHPANYESLSVLLGQPLETVCSKLELPVEELPALSQSVYKLPTQTTYAGVSFDVLLSINLYENTLHGIRYTVTYEWNETQKAQAAKDVVAIADMLTKAMGSTYVNEEAIISDISESALVKAFSQNEVFHENNYWDLTQDAPSEVTNYIEHLETTDFWKTYAQFKNPKACYYLDFDVICDPSFEQLGITLEYKIDAFRGSGNYEEVEGGIISPN